MSEQLAMDEQLIAVIPKNATEEFSSGFMKLQHQLCPSPRGPNGQCPHPNIPVVGGGRSINLFTYGTVAEALLPPACCRPAYVWNEEPRIEAYGCRGPTRRSPQ